jgi:phage-related minor tail protein
MALNVGNLVATLGLDKKGFDTGIQDAAKKTEGFAGGFSDKLSSLSPTLATMGEKVKGATSGIASKLSSLSPTLAAVGDKFKGVTAGISSGLSSLAAPIGAAKDKLIGLATGFASKMKTLAVPIAAVGAAIASLGTAAVLAADNINKAYNAIRVGSGATGEDLEALKSDFDAVFGTIPAGAGEVGTAIADLNTRLGLTGKPLQNMATRFLELSRITGTDVASNIKEVTRLFGNWSVAAEEQTGMLDYLFKVSQSTGIGVDRLSTLTTQYGSTLRGLGFDLKGSVAVLGKFEKGGVNIEAALAGMKMGLGNLAGKGITDPVEALDELARQVREAGTEIEAVSIAAEVFGARGAAEMAAAIRSGNLDLGDFVTMLDASEETVLTAADASMSLGDRMAILQHKAEKALQPVGNLMIGVFETAMPHLEAAGDALVEAGESVATWAEEAVAAAGPVVDALQEKMTPAVEFFQGRMDHVVTWWDENSKIFIAAWENIAAAISWVIETVSRPTLRVGMALHRDDHLRGTGCDPGCRQTLRLAYRRGLGGCRGRAHRHLQRCDAGARRRDLNGVGRDRYRDRVRRTGDPGVCVRPVEEHRAVDRGLSQQDDRPDQWVHRVRKQSHGESGNLAPKTRPDPSPGGQD